MLQRVSGLLDPAGLLLVTLDVVYQTHDLAVVGVQLQAGLRHQQGVVQPIQLQQQLAVPEHGLRAVRTEREGLAESEIGFLEHPLILGVGFGAIFRRA